MPGRTEGVVHILREDIDATTYINGLRNEEEALRLQHVSPPGERQ